MKTLFKNPVNPLIMAVMIAAILFTTSCGLHGLLDDSATDLQNSSSSGSNVSSSSNRASSSSSSNRASNSSSSDGASSSSANASTTDKGNDINNYKTVTIGEQTWMAENLNYKIGNSLCYGENGSVYNYDPEELKWNITLTPEEVQANCDKYGRLYDWATAMAFDSTCNRNSCASRVQRKHRGICPSDWHIPTQADYDTLMKYVELDQFCNARECAGLILKARSGWRKNEIFDGNGTDYYGFAALPGGYGYFDDGDFSSEGRHGYWWSSSEDNDRAFSLSIRDSDVYSLSAGYKVLYGYSVRCIKD